MKGLSDCVELSMLAQEKYFCGRSSLLDQPRRIQSVQSGHADIQHDDVRLQVHRLYNRFRAIRSVAHDIKVGLGTKECANCLPGDRMIVNHENMRNLAHAHPNVTLAANRCQKLYPP